MVGPASATAGVDIQRGYALKGVIPVGIDLEIAQVKSQTFALHPPAHAVPRTRAFQGFRMPKVSLANGSIAWSRT
jgi:hypothetical protein